MTCIAWDGKTLAADKMASYDGLKNKVTKIHRVGDVLVGSSGTLAFCNAMIEWVRGGRIPADFITLKGYGKNDWQPTLVIESDGSISIYEHSPYPIRYEQQHVAIGCGREYARAAMHLGLTAREAVQVAIDLDSGCGLGIDVLELEK